LVFCSEISLFGKESQPFAALSKKGTITADYQLTLTHMNTSKGYIVPVILVVLLLAIAGVFIFTQTPVESPVVDTTPTPATSTTSHTTPVATTTDSDDEDDNDAGVFSSTSVPVIIDTAATTSIEEE
jgi:hypothetical protein